MDSKYGIERIFLKNCISNYKKYIFILIISLFFFLLSIFFSSKFFLIVLLLGIIDFYIKCPKCGYKVGLSKNGYITLNIFNQICSKCGQNLNKCEIEPDEITNQRLKQKNDI